VTDDDGSENGKTEGDQTGYEIEEARERFKPASEKWTAKERATATIESISEIAISAQQSPLKRLGFAELAIDIDKTGTSTPILK
jgi:hypothetical protein